MAARGKKFRGAVAKVDRTREYPIPEAVALRNSLSSDHLFVVRVYHSRVSTGNRVGMAMLGMSKEDHYGSSVAMLDGRTGEVLWADWFAFDSPATGGYTKRAGTYVPDKLLKPMP